MATTFPVGTTAHTKAKEAAKKLAAWIKNNTTPTPRPGTKASSFSETSKQFET